MITKGERVALISPVIEVPGEYDAPILMAGIKESDAILASLMLSQVYTNKAKVRLSCGNFDSGLILYAYVQKEASLLQG